MNMLSKIAKLLIKPYVVVILLLIIATGLREWLYRSLLTYKPAIERKSYDRKNEKLIHLLEMKIETEKAQAVDQIIGEALRITSNQLHFTFSENQVDPNQLIETKSAHCIGYAAFFVTTCNYLLKKNNLEQQWKASHKAGHLHLLGLNIHFSILPDIPFLKNHDFVMIENQMNGKVLKVDPGLYDYFYIRYVE